MASTQQCSHMVPRVWLPIVFNALFRLHCVASHTIRSAVAEATLSSPLLSEAYRLRLRRDSDDPCLTARKHGP